MDEELTSVSFKDTAFLQAFGLHELNIIEYFSKSQFYDVSCIDEQLKMQARFNDLQVTQLDHTKMTGIKYDLWYFTYQPSYFVIKKSQIYSETRAELLAIYYVIEGTIYQAPSLSSVLTNRTMTSLFYLNKAFDVGTENSRFHPLQGYRWLSDEPELIDAANASDKNAKLSTVNDQRIAFEFQNQMDKIIVDTFKVEPVKEIQESPPPVVTPVEESAAEIKVKRKKKEAGVSKKKKDVSTPK
ncbi:hypothetical protein HK103_003738 [Boothiomyces macroporosus]|uniref:Mediator of RNA polymerase II transcription subunit 6 n=1 Tax=Boothiomyces macroporosus TaxID=261099 RepID=A0AAD5UHH9_9FUNG|nr:hypothetical protein HK103_003738 [Boothiomyces macroporosus]